MFQITDTVKHLIIINVLLFITPQIMPALGIDSLFALYFPENEKFGFWQFVTHMFMHGGFGHILFNMYGLWAFGSPLEQMWGRNKFLFFYFSAGLGAGIIYTLVNYYQFDSIYDSLVQLGVTSDEISRILNTNLYNYESFKTDIEEILRHNTSLKEHSINLNVLIELNSLFHTPAVGASGAIYGVLVAFGLSFPNAKLALIFLPVPISAKYFIPGIILLDLFFGLTSYSIGNIAHFAHLGGALIGFIIAWYWKQNQFKRWN